MNHIRKSLKKTKTVRIVIALLLVCTMTIPMCARAEYAKTDIKGYIYSGERSATFNCIFFDGVPVPYVSILQYFGATYDTDYILRPEGDGRYRFYNDRGYMIFNPANDTIVINSMEAFLYNDFLLPNSPDSSAGGDGNKINPYYSYKGNVYLDGASEIELDLGKYGIHIIEENGIIYLPLTALHILTGGTYDVLVYSNNLISITSGSDKPIIDCSTNYNSLTREASEAEYTYNNLSLFMDTAYGCPPLCSMSEDIRNSGFDAAMEATDERREVKRLLKSTDMVDFLFGMTTLSEMLYDGGHTDFFDPIKDNLETASVTKFKEIVQNTDDPRAELLRKWREHNRPDRDTHEKIERYVDGYKAYTPYFIEYDEDNMIKFAYYEYDDTAIFVFSEFNDDTLKFFKQSLDLAKEHGMKNFLLDESRNKGGKVAVLCYMLGLVTDNPSYYFKGTFTGDMLKTSYDCDYNLDGKFGDSKQDVGYNFNYGILCSSNSFSCGNSLPVYAKERGIPILGETSGGGTCMVGYYALPNTYLGDYSAYKILTRMDGRTVEDGASPDYDITKRAADGSVDYTDFHNFALLDYILDTHYGNTSLSSSAVTRNVKVTNVPKTYDYLKKIL